jgi:hypothetical protein
MQRSGRKSRWLLICVVAACSAVAQQVDPSLAALVTSGSVTVDGMARQYVVHHLPPTSFPELPAGVVDVLDQRGCLIPQTYQAHHPENVIHGSFQRAGSADWAVLCSVQGNVSLLVFFASAPGEPAIVATGPETRRLQVHDSTGVLGFDWAIDAASPQTVHDAQIGLTPKPPALDHDAVADSVVDRRTKYHYFSKDGWGLVDLPD